MVIVVVQGGCQTAVHHLLSHTGSTLLVELGPNSAQEFVIVDSENVNDCSISEVVY